MQAYHLRQAFFWPAAAIVLAFASGARADDNDPAAIEQRLKALESTPEQQALIREPAANARRAMKRVLDARAAGDAAHAVELAALADDWVKLAANVLRAKALEISLASTQKRLTQLDQTRRNTETLLEATIAQRERTREELRRLKAAKAATTQPDLTEAKPSRDAEANRAKKQPKQPNPARSTTPKAASKTAVKP